MFASMIDFANLLLAALVVGALFGVSLFLNPAGLDVKSYILVQQQGIRTMNNVMPALGAATILLTIAAVLLGRGDSGRLQLLLGGIVCFVTIGLVTRFLNQPINAVVATWHADLPPYNWTKLRDEWWRWHLIRLATGILGLSLLIAAAVKQGWNG